MKLIRVENYEEMSSKAAQLVEQQILDNSHSVLGLDPLYHLETVLLSAPIASASSTWAL